MRIESELTTNPGLPERNWYKNWFYAPRGYNSVALAGVKDALHAKKMKIAQNVFRVLLKILTQVVECCKKALTIIKDEGNR